MNFIVQNSGSYTNITLFKQNLDTMLAPDLKSELVTIVENGEKNILVDLSICTFCDPSGMSALLLGKRICDGVNGNFILYGLTPGIVKMMDLIGFESLMKIAANREGAEALLV